MSGNARQALPAPRPSEADGKARPIPQDRFAAEQVIGAIGGVRELSVRRLRQPSLDHVVDIEASL